MNRNIIWAFAGGPAIPQKMMMTAEIVLVNHGELTEIVKNRHDKAGWIQTANVELYLSNPNTFETQTIFLNKGLTAR